jgi:uncharacterized protein YndB with AHSA1/START domain
VALLNVIVKRSPEQVWDFLSDGHRYAEWVVGTREIRAVDDGWPAVGKSIHFTLGRGPLALSDRTTVRNAEPPRMLEMEVSAGRLGAARLLFDIRPWGEHAVVVLDEHPLSGPGAHLHNFFVDVALRFRNRRMLDKLARLIEQEYDAPSPVGVGARR